MKGDQEPRANSSEPSSRLDVAITLERDSFRLTVEESFERGICVIWGPSGTGKSTFLRALAGLVQPATGSIAYGASTWFRAGSISLTPSQRKLSWLSQTPALFPHMRASDNVAFGLSALSRRDRDERVQQIMQRVSALHLAGRRPNELSGGEAQRVALARALAPRPKVLLCDEPFSALDPALREQMAKMLNEYVRAESALCLLITHDTQEAALFADSTYSIVDGSLRREP
jgi:ABC-type Fe3+/spermidine/putrescine transport system ATPase subunit